MTRMKIEKGRLRAIELQNHANEASIHRSADYKRQRAAREERKNVYSRAVAATTFVAIAAYEPSLVLFLLQERDT